MRIIGSTWGCLKKAERCWGHPRGRWMRTGVAPMQFALLMPAVAPTSNSYMHTDRCPPPWLAINMGVSPSLFVLVMSAAAPTSNSHLHTDRWP